MNGRIRFLRWISLGLMALMMALLPLGTKAIAHIQEQSTLAVAQALPSVEPSAGAPSALNRFATDAIATPSTYIPRQQQAPAHPTNYGERFLVDAGNQPVYNDLIAVIHETVGSADSAIRLFQTAHYRDSDQVSYHTLIRQDGTVVYVVPPERRAFGAGNSVFVGPNGVETVRTNAAFPPSVNNFAYHISLETPADGRGNRRTHSGYTEAQYRSLAWVIAQTQIPDERVTTHQTVDRSGNRLDPRSFDRQRFFTLLHSYRPTKDA